MCSSMQIHYLGDNKYLSYKLQVSRSKMYAYLQQQSLRGSVGTPHSDQMQIRYQCPSPQRALTANGALRRLLTHLSDLVSDSNLNFESNTSHLALGCTVWLG